MVKKLYVGLKVDVLQMDVIDVICTSAETLIKDDDVMFVQ